MKKLNACITSASLRVFSHLHAVDDSGETIQKPPFLAQAYTETPLSSRNPEKPCPENLMVRRRDVMSRGLGPVSLSGYTVTSTTTTTDSSSNATTRGYKPLGTQTICRL